MSGLLPQEAIDAALAAHPLYDFRRDPTGYSRWTLERALTAAAPHIAARSLAAVEAVLELHKEVQWAESWPTCLHCNDGEGSPLAYPCLTVATIRTALGEGEQ